MNNLAFSFSHSLSLSVSLSVWHLSGRTAGFISTFGGPRRSEHISNKQSGVISRKKGLKKGRMNLIQSLIQKVPALQNQAEVEGGRWPYRIVCKVQSVLLQGSGKLVAGLYGGWSDINITSYVPEVWSKLARAHRCVCMFWQYCRDEFPRRLQHPTQSSCCTQTPIQSQRSTVCLYRTYPPVPCNELILLMAFFCP